MNYIKTKIPLADQIDHIMDHFDFERVAKVMKLMNWTWSDKEPPSIPEMREEARRLLKSLGDECVAVSTGGFYASKDGWGQLGLAFVITDWDASEFCATKEGRDF